MSPAMFDILRKLTAVAAGLLLVVSLSAIAVTRAENRDRELVAADEEGGQANGFAPGRQGDGGSGADRGAAAGAQPTGGGAEAPTSDTGGGQAPAPGEQQQAASGEQQAAAGGQSCPDYNPNEGVFCDRFLVGGTTVLSGPLAVYGEQGLAGFQSWLKYFNTEIAAKEGIRKIQLIWYDDNLDPNKTVQFVQRLYEVDKVLMLSGITSPEAASTYLEEKQFPMIGDIGLSPKSYKNSMIFPTAPPDEQRALLRTRIAVEDFGIKSMAVIQDILPGVDSTPIRRAWEDAAKKYGVEINYQEIESTASDCSAQFLNASREQPEFMQLPIAAPPMLACLRTANTQGVKPKATTSTWLKGWAGGSNLQIEIDQCMPTCDGMYSGGTIFRDPRTFETPEVQTYRDNMARYAPGIDITGFITINYYHAGWLQYQVMKQGGILQNISRKTVVDAANRFGPFETGFGNTVEWRPTVPRIPTTCGYRVKASQKENKWIFDDQKICA